jgi:RND superfamily putative drug exporter
VILAALVARGDQPAARHRRRRHDPKSGDAKQGLVALERSGIGEGALLPHEILVTGTRPEGRARARARSTASTARSRPSARVARGGTAVVDAFPTPDGSSQAGATRSTTCATRARRRPGRARRRPAGAERRLHRRGLRQLPADDRADRVITFVLLARAFRSLLLPLKAVVLNVISVAAAWGVLVLVWQEGHGSEAIWGIRRPARSRRGMPLMVFAFLFGLSMDYEVFILARMREEYDATGSTDEAVVRGIGRTGRLVTSAALILFLAFVSMASGPDTDVKVFATGLAAGILLDATSSARCSCRRSSRCSAAGTGPCSR